MGRKTKVSKEQADVKVAKESKKNEEVSEEIQSFKENLTKIILKKEEEKEKPTEVAILAAFKRELDFCLEELYDFVSFHIDGNQLYNFGKLISSLGLTIKSTPTRFDDYYIVELPKKIDGSNNNKEAIIIYNNFKEELSKKISERTKIMDKFCLEIKEDLQNGIFDQDSNKYNVVLTLTKKNFDFIKFDEDFVFKYFDKYGLIFCGFHHENVDKETNTIKLNFRFTLT